MLLSDSSSHPFVGHSEMSALVRALDWSQTALGPIEHWPQSLRTAVSLCLFSPSPIIIWWGPEFIEIYNDAYRAILGPKHPTALGQRADETWPEIWPIIGPMMDCVYGGGDPVWSEHQLLPIARYGYTEEAYFTFSYSPIFDESGGIGGIFTTAIETTAQILGERRAETMRRVREQASAVTSAKQACQEVTSILHDNASDTPFALLYLVDDARETASLIAHTKDIPSYVPLLESLSLAETPSPWPFAPISRADDTVLIEDLSASLAVPDVPPGQKALVLPLMTARTQAVTGYLIVGLSLHLRFDDPYRDFLRTLAEYLSIGLANAQAYEEEQRQIEAQQELERARAELDRERERIVDIFASISDAFVALDRHYRFTYLNPQAIDMFWRLTGQPHDFFMDQVIWETFPGTYDSLFGEAYRRAMDDNVSVQFEAYFVPLETWFEVRVYPSKEGLSIYFANVTERYETQRVLQEAQERLQLMLNSAKDYAIFAFNHEGLITHWNSGAERVFGYREEEILGQSQRLLYTPEDVAAQVPEQERRTAVVVGYAEDERWHPRKDGTRFYASGVVRPIHSDTEALQGFTKVARDTTQHQHAIQRTQLLQQLAADLSAHAMLDDMAETIMQYSLTAVGGAMGGIYLLNPETRQLERLVMEGFLPASRKQFAQIDVEAAYPMAEAVRIQQPIWLESQADYLARYPHLREAVLQNNLHASFDVPLMLETRILGALTIAFYAPKILLKEERELLIAVAHLCAQALERARLYEQAQTLAAHRERQRLARDLHDAVNQTLFSAMMITESLPRLWKRDPERVFPLLEQVRVLNKAAAAEMRVLLGELRPEALENTPLEDLYTQLANTIPGRKQMQVSVNFELPVSLSLPLPVHMAFYRIAQEALNNVVKHSQAQNLTLSLISLSDRVELSIIDDGIGFETTPGSGIGMGSMRERAEEMKAALTVTSIVEKGTEVVLIWHRP